MPACDELTEFDLLTLREGAARGQIKVVLWREGKRDPDAEPVKERLDLLCACGFLERTSQGGSKGHLSGAEYFALYTLTLAGRVAIEALDELERLRGSADR